MAETYVITILILIFFYTFLLTILSIEDWPITILIFKKSLAIFVSTLISSSFLICITLLPFNVIYCSDGSEDVDYLESGQITPTQANPSGQSSNKESSGEATPKANKENKLNLGEANKKLEKNSTPLAGVGTVPDPGELCRGTPDNIQESADMKNSYAEKYEEILKYLSTKDWRHKVSKKKLEKFLTDNPELSNLEIKKIIFNDLIAPSN